MTPMKAIRAKCLDCCCGQVKEVRLYPCQNCPLYPYRMGKRPRTAANTCEEADGENTADSPCFFEKEANT